MSPLRSKLGKAVGWMAGLVAVTLVVYIARLAGMSLVGDFAAGFAREAFIPHLYQAVLSRLPPAAGILLPLFPLGVMTLLVRAEILPRPAGVVASFGMALSAVIGLAAEIGRLTGYWARYPIDEILMATDVAVLLPALVAIALATAPWLPGSRLFPRRAPKLAKAADAHYGQDDFMDLDAAASLLSAKHGVVLGEAVRVDGPELAGIDFREDDRKTWGGGGRSRLLIYDGQCGSPHGMIFAGTGAGKTSGVIIPTALRWQGSMVLNDPAGEAAPILERVRRSQGRRVVVMDARTGSGGCNVLHGLDLTDPITMIRVRALAACLTGYSAGGKDGKGGGENAFFESRACALIEALILLELAIAPGATLKNVYADIAMGMAALATALQGAAEDEHLPEPIRQAAGEFVGLPDRTWGSIFAAAADAIHWLGVESLAALVCGQDFQAEELPRGGLDVFLCIPIEVSLPTPGISRLLLETFVSAMERADGRQKERLLLLVDEAAASLGTRLACLERARDTGRKFGISLVLCFQSIGQLDAMYGREGRNAWLDNLGFRIHAVVQNEDDAKLLEGRCGSRTVIEESESRGQSANRAPGQITGHSSANINRSSRPVAVPVLRAADVFRMRRDEQIIILAGQPAIRCVRAYYFRRPDMVAMVDGNRFVRTGGLGTSLPG